MLMITGAHIHTMWSAMPIAQAAMIEDGRFAYVGTEEGARLWAGAKKYRAVDAQGASVIPGINDAHLHFLHTALRSLRVDLTGCASVQAVQQRLRAACATHAGGWLVAEGWNQEQFDLPKVLCREDLDVVSKEIPIFAVRACGHIAAVNTPGLARTGLDKADGLLREDEQDAVWAQIPQLDVQGMLKCLMNAQHGLYAKGITSIQSDDLGSIPKRDWASYLHAIVNAQEAGKLHCRYALQALLPKEDVMRSFFGEGLHLAQGPRMQVSCAKLLADGSLGARTAWLSRPYADAPGESGIAMYTQEELSALVSLAASKGLPSAVHAIGDAALSQVLTAFEGAPGLRHAVVHAQISTAQQVRQMGARGLVAMVQPIFLDADISVVQSRVGEALAETSYRWRSMLSMGAHIAFGTDCPVEPYDPMANLQCAMSRKGLHGGPAYLPQEAFTLEEALYAYTAQGAYASGEEGRKGRIAPGMLADFVILDRKLDEKMPASLLETGVRQTYIGGDCVYSV